MASSSGSVASTGNVSSVSTNAVLLLIGGNSGGRLAGALAGGLSARKMRACGAASSIVPVVLLTAPAVAFSPVPIQNPPLVTVAGALAGGLRASISRACADAVLRVVVVVSTSPAVVLTPITP